MNYSCIYHEGTYFVSDKTTAAVELHATMDNAPAILRLGVWSGEDAITDEWQLLPALNEAQAIREAIKRFDAFVERLRQAEGK